MNKRLKVGKKNLCDNTLSNGQHYHYLHGGHGDLVQGDGEGVGPGAAGERGEDGGEERGVGRREAGVPAGHAVHTPELDLQGSVNVGHCEFHIIVD